MRTPHRWGCATHSDNGRSDEDGAQDAELDPADDEEAVSPRAAREQMREALASRGKVARPRRSATRRFHWLMLLIPATLALVAAIGVFVVLNTADPDRVTMPDRLAGALPGWFGGRQAKEAPPVVEPSILMDVPPETARQLNAAVPYATGPIPAARPFHYPGSPENRAGARICLAAAVLYEAGDSPIDQYAVAQVVLNRVRHPAFAKTVCGVVFEGAERRTGCQFTFACDGALQRRPSVDVWNRALATADLALDGFVFTPVGTATHYHTDWVFPYWQAKLTKLANVHTHIFYRWPGWWGTSPAFSGNVRGTEHVDPRLLAFAGTLPTATVLPEDVTDDVVTHATIDGPSIPSAPTAPVAVRVPGVPAGMFGGNIARLYDETSHLIVLQLDAKAFPGSYAILANAICAERPTCLVLGYAREEAVPKGLPLATDSVRRADFLYRRTAGVEMPEMQWNCALFPRSSPRQCRPA